MKPSKETSKISTAWIITEKVKIAGLIEESAKDLVLKLRRDGMIQNEIAKVLKEEFPHTLEKKSIESIRSWVSLFLKNTLSDKERISLNKETHFMTRASEEERLNFSKMGNASISSKQKFAHGKALAESQGKTPFSEEEKYRIAELSLQEQFTTSYRGNIIPNYRLISQILNEEFHNGKEIRNWRLLQKWMNIPKRKTEFERLKQSINNKKEQEDI